MYLPGSNNVPEAIIALDAHEAFDRIEHTYLHILPQKFGIWTFVLFLGESVLLLPTGCSQD